MKVFPLVFSLAFISLLLPAQDWPEILRVLPPVGVEVPADVLEPIKTRLAALEARFAPLRDQPYAADVAVLLKAVRFALDIGEFYDAAKDPAKALAMLDMAEKRMGELGRAELPSWISQVGGRVARGFYSKIDGSPQPYVLELPEGIKLDITCIRRHPTFPPINLLVWLHGRGDKETDLHFISNRLAKPGEFHPQRTVVLHAFGRHCLGFKSAGETDVLEAMWAMTDLHILNLWPTPPILAGFSMGGAGAWHLGAHYPSQFAGVHAGAGFVDVKRYRKLKPEDYPPAWEQTLWGLYDVPDYVRNFRGLPVLAYSGEIDPQKASADIMEGAFQAEGATLPRLIGKGMGHKYDPTSKQEITAWFERVFAAQHQFPDKMPAKKVDIHLQTKTLRYAIEYQRPTQLLHVAITGLEKHWQDSRLDIETKDNSATLHITTKNLTSFRIDAADDTLEKARLDPVPMVVDGVKIPYEFKPGLLESRPDEVALIKENGQWKAGKPEYDTLRKSPLYQGPIDAAFMEPFLVVLPEKPCANPQVEKWVQYELKHFQRRWREVFRGDLRQKKASEVTKEDMEKYHLVAWGDPASNSIIAKAVAVGFYPLEWDEETVNLTGKPSQPSATTVPLMIWPNPLAIDKYLVLNSGPTFREAHDKTNSLQNPKLPDWALLDITVPPDAEKVGRVIEAGFFDESWK